MSVDPIGEVIAAMADLRSGGSRHNGIGIFGDVCLRATEKVKLQVADGGFADAGFVEHLDVVLARIFLQVPTDANAGRPVDHAWRPLVERRGRHDLLPIQFTLAGANAHLARDLPIALVRTCRERGVSPHAAGVRDDFEQVGGALTGVVRPIRKSYLDGHTVASGRPLSPLADLVTNYSLDKARDAAWVAALTLWEIREVAFLERSFERTLGRNAGLVSRQLLVSFTDPLATTQPLSEDALFGR